MSRHQSQPKGNTSKERQRDTHFLCFPLTKSSSIPQLAESLTYFRRVTTKTVPQCTLHEVTTEEDGTPSITIQLRPHVESVITTGDQSFKIIHPKAHRPPGTFHLTLGVMNLSDKADMDRALELLQSLDYTTLLREATTENRQDVRKSASSTSDKSSTGLTSGEPLQSLGKPISPPPTSRLPSSSTSPSSVDQSSPLPISISLLGLAAFSSPESARVFYAKPHDPTYKLYALGQVIREKFREAGFINETRALVLHATVANLKYAAQGGGGRGSRGKKWKVENGQVDARELVRAFDQCAGIVEGIGSHFRTQAGQYVWAKDVVVDRVAICRMGAEKSDDELLGLVYPPVGEKMIISDSRE